jgi:hypothetical protein
MNIDPFLLLPNLSCRGGRKRKKEREREGEERGEEKEKTELKISLSNLKSVTKREHPSF